MTEKQIPKITAQESMGEKCDAATQSSQLDPSLAGGIPGNAPLPVYNVSGTKSTQSSREALLAEYEHCASDIRNFDSMLWQIPSIGALAFSAVAWFGSQAAALPSWVASVSLFVEFILLFALTIALHKNRFFQKSRVKSLKEIWEKLKASGLEVYGIPITRSEIIYRYRAADDISKSFLFRLSAYNLLCFSMWALLVISFLMFLRSLLCAMSITYF